MATTRTAPAAKATAAKATAPTAPTATATAPTGATAVTVAGTVAANVPALAHLCSLAAPGAPTVALAAPAGPWPGWGKAVRVTVGGVAGAVYVNRGNMDLRTTPGHAATLAAAYGGSVRGPQGQYVRLPYTATGTPQA